MQTTYSITPNPASVNENAGSLTFTVSRSPSTSAATVYVSTVQDPNHPNTNNYYYNGFVAQPLNFSAGQSTATVTVTINDENLTSGSESPSLLVQTLSGGVYSNAASDTFTINNTDVVQTTYSITPNPASVNENAGSLTFTVSRSPSTSAATVYVSTVQDPNHPNTNNYYYNGFVAQPLNFSAGQSTATVTVTINDENLTSGSESPSLLVQTLSGGVYSNAASDTFTINNTDVVQTTYSITPNPASVNENAGSLTFTVSRSPSTSAATVYVSTVQDPNHPNTNNYYYNGFVAQPLNFSAGQSTATVTVTINDENLTSGSESPSLLVQTLSGGVYSNAASDTFTINNTDVVQTTYSITPNPASVNENAGSLTFTVSRSPSTSAATVYVSTVQDPNHPNTNNYYYNGFVAQPLNFSAGQSTATVTVTINDENLTSGSESPSLLVQTLSGGVYSNAASDTFTINNTDVATPTITSPPSSQSVKAGQTATFNVAASGTAPLSYQWQKMPSGGSSYTSISGATGTSYTTLATTTGDSGTQFRCVVSNSAGTVNSNAATLTVTSAVVAPTITSPPSSQSVKAGQTATFNVAASGTAPLSYQWQKMPSGGSSYTSISGATGTSYTTLATTTGDSGTQFRCVVSNSAGTVNSNAATLTVTSAVVAPTITSPPSSQSVKAGQTATFNVAASGTAPLSYQWQKMPSGGSSYTSISGATGTSYTTLATTTGDSGTQFRCVVSNSAGTVNSNAATLTVNAVTGVDGATFVSKTIADHTVENQNAAFTQTFYLKNTGNTTWNNFTLVHVTSVVQVPGSDSLGCSSTPIQIPTTQVGATVTVDVPLTATKTSGGSAGAAQLAYWEIKDGTTQVPITYNGTFYWPDNSYAPNKLWTAITINPTSGPMVPNLNSSGYKLVDPSNPAFKPINPYVTIGDGGTIGNGGDGGQCTAFVWGRVYEELGKALVPAPADGTQWTFAAGQEWIDALADLGYGPLDLKTLAVDTAAPKGETTPTADSIAVWQGNGIGHVAYVESVTTSGTTVTVTVNEANVVGYPAFADTYDPWNNDPSSKILSPSGWGAGYGGKPTPLSTSLNGRFGYNFLGYIDMSPPKVTLTTPSTTQCGNVNIGYTLTDADSQSCDIVPEYSVDGGKTWKMATPGPGGDGTKGLASSPGGSSYTFVWSSNNDILSPSGSNNASSSNVEFRISPYYTAPGAAGTTGSFAVDNTPSPTASTTSVGVNVSASSAKYGQPVNLTASVTEGSASPGARYARANIVMADTAAPTGGTVAFMDGADLLGTATLTNGTASLTTTSLASGSSVVTATYSGDGSNFAGSVAAAGVSVTVSQALPTLSVVDAGGTYNGSAFPATATVAGAISGVDATAQPSLESVFPTITYYVGTTVSGGGSAAPPSAPGTYTVVASFAGSPNYAAASSKPLIFSILAPSQNTVFLAPDPLDSTKQALYVYGTAGNDVILVNPGSASGSVTVMFNGKSYGSFSPTGRIIVHGLAGNDYIGVSSQIVLPAWLYGDDGDDVLVGGGGPNILFGGAGNNTLWGGKGRNILIGGTGRNLLIGGAGDGLLIGGTTAYDANDLALQAMMNEWNCSADCADPHRLSDRQEGRPEWLVLSQPSDSFRQSHL